MTASAHGPSTASTPSPPARRLHRGYALATVLLLAVEVLIAMFVRDRFVRPYLGDALAVALVFCGLRALLDLSATTAAAIAFAIAVVIEFGQYVHVLRLVGLEQNRFARTVLGSGFDPRDFLAYAAGAVAMLAIGLIIDSARSGGPCRPEERS